MQKLFSPLFALIALLTFATAQAAELQPMTIDGAKTVTAEELLDLVDQHDNLVIIDARGQGDYDKGHLPEVIRIKNDDVTPETLAAAIPTKDTPVCFYCNGVKCARSADAAAKATAAGYTNIYWFRGGISEWQEKGFPVEL